MIEDGGVTFTVYQPQIDVFEDDNMEARAAVQVESKVGDKTQTNYGVVWIKAHPFVDKEAGLVQFDDIEITKVSFPTLGDKTETYLEILRRNTEQSRSIPLERIEANLAITQADKRGNAVPLKNEPPRIYYRSTPALLLLIDGDPVLRPVEGSSLQRIVNTRNLIVQDAGAYYLPIADRWFQSAAPTGPWTLAASAPAAVQAVRDAIAGDENQTQVDLVLDPGEDIAGSPGEGHRAGSHRQHGARRADRDAGQAADEAGHGHPAALCRQHQWRHSARLERPELLRPPDRPLVSREVARRALAVRRRQRPAQRLRQDTGRRPRSRASSRRSQALPPPRRP